MTKIKYEVIEEGVTKATWKDSEGLHVVFAIRDFSPLELVELEKRTFGRVLQAWFVSYLSPGETVAENGLQYIQKYPKELQKIIKSTICAKCYEKFAEKAEEQDLQAAYELGKPREIDVRCSYPETPCGTTPLTGGLRVDEDGTLYWGDTVIGTSKGFTASTNLRLDKGVLYSATPLEGVVNEDLKIRQELQEGPPEGLRVDKGKEVDPLENAYSNGDACGVEAGGIDISGGFQPSSPIEAINTAHDPEKTTTRIEDGKMMWGDMELASGGSSMDVPDGLQCVKDGCIMEVRNGLWETLRTVTEDTFEVKVKTTKEEKPIMKIKERVRHAYYMKFQTHDNRIFELQLPPGDWKLENSTIYEKRERIILDYADSNRGNSVGGLVTLYEGRHESLGFTDVYQLIWTDEFLPILSAEGSSIVEMKTYSTPIVDQEDDSNGLSLSLQTSFS